RATPPGDPADPLAEALPWAESGAAAALAAAFVTAFLVQPFRIPTGSMEDTLRAGDRVLVEKVSRRLGPARRGDLLAFRFPDDRPSLHCTGLLGSKDFLKRVVGLPGETLQVKDAVLLVGGVPAPEPWAKRLSAGACAAPPAALTPAEYQKAWEEGRLDQEQGEGLRDHFGPVVVPPGSTLVLGDNRDASCDSRFWGPVPERFVKGKAVFIYWPPSRIGRPR
ncbi:MAG: signal peptidase I, partial [Elusimicrobia bacterium]|nr:signal peptidase I [Elusimicrobiota bacterium]